MELTKEIINASYGYLAGGSVSYSATLLLKNGEEIVGQTGLSATTNFMIEGWKDRLKEAIVTQANEYIQQWKFMLQLVQITYPNATKPDDALVALTEEVASEITI